MRQTLSITALLAVLAVTNAAADPAPFMLDTARSAVGFTYYFGSNSDDGNMPVAMANLLIDLDDLGKSEIDVSVDASQARTGFFLATQALRGARILDTERHPFIRFQSERITALQSGARIEGTFTIRGVARPGILMAQLFQQPSADDPDEGALSLLLTGSINRSEFGASGYARQVGDTVDLRILARISRQ